MLTTMPATTEPSTIAPVVDAAAVMRLPRCGVMLAWMEETQKNVTITQLMGKRKALRARGMHVDVKMTMG